MNRTARHAGTPSLLLAATVALSAGCVTGQRAQSTPERVTITAPTPAQNDADNTHARIDSGPPTIGVIPRAEMIELEVDSFDPTAAPETFHAAAPSFVGGNRTPPPANSSRLISLWGDELIDADTDVPGRHDASANVRQVSFATEGSTFDPDINRSGTALVFSSTRHRATSDIYLKSVTGTTVTQLTSDPAHDIMPAFDPTGQTIAFASDRSGRWNIYVMDVSGGQPVQVTSDRDPEMHPTWSPDGRTLSYCRFGSRTGRWEIWVVDVNNPSTPSFLTFGVFPTWSPDVTTGRLLFQRPRERGSRYHSIWTVDVINGEARRPTEIASADNAALINPAWSPDGRKISFAAVVDPPTSTTEAPGRSDIWVVNINGTNRTNLTNGRMANFQPVWSSDGSIYFVSDRSGADNIWAVAASGAANETDLTHPGHDSMANVLQDVMDAGGAPE